MKFGRKGLRVTLHSFVTQDIILAKEELGPDIFYVQIVFPFTYY